MAELSQARPRAKGGPGCLVGLRRLVSKRLRLLMWEREGDFSPAVGQSLAYGSNCGISREQGIAEGGKLVIIKRTWEGKTMAATSCPGSGNSSLRKPVAPHPPCRVVHSAKRSPHHHLMPPGTSSAPHQHFSFLDNLNSPSWLVLQESKQAWGWVQVPACAS